VPTKYFDKSGREWPVEITIGLLEDMLQQGIDLELIVSDGGERAAAFLCRPSQIVRVLAAICCVPEADRKEFVRSIGAPELQQARTLILSAIANFSLPPSAAKQFSLSLPAMLGDATGEAVTQ
jgi:hypothetical protein